MPLCRVEQLLGGSATLTFSSCAALALAAALSMLGLERRVPAATRLTQVPVNG